MPKGVYVRSPAHKHQLREQLVVARENPMQGRYERTTAHKEAFIARMRSVPRFGEDAPNWRGDAVGYMGVHTWIRKMRGRPSKCEECGTEKVTCYDWANISGKYLRRVEDWRRLCRSCHMKSDGRGKAASIMMCEAREGAKNEV